MKRQETKQKKKRKKNQERKDIFVDGRVNEKNLGFDRLKGGSC